jgi:hypothetical protein
MAAPSRSSRIWLGILFFAGAVGILAIGSYWHSSDLAKEPNARTHAWIVIMVIVVAGYAINGKFLGALIDERKMVSLSRFQIALWTTVVLSAFLEIALSNIHMKVTDPLGISVPSQIWAVLGISTTSLIGSPLIREAKRRRNPDRSVTQANLSKAGKAQGRPLANDGQVVNNLDIDKAGWADMFRGEDVADADNLDLGKIQMFLFTVIVVAAYAIAIGGLLLENTPAGAPALGIKALPLLDASMVVLLGISHAGYLGNKAVPRGKTDDGAPDVQVKVNAMGAVE